MPHSGQPDTELLKMTPLAQELRPKLMLAIYEIEEGKSYIEIAKVDKRGRVLSFAPMSTKSAYRFAEQLLRYRYVSRYEGTLKSWIGGPRIVQIQFKTIDHFAVAWRYEQSKAMMNYAPELHISNGEIHTPHILFYYSVADKEIYVWAYREWKNKATQLYHLPFHNVYESGKVCMGATRIRYTKTDTLDSFLNRIEWLFFNTAASEIHFTKGWKGNINTLHKKLRKGEPFPLDKLIESTKLSALISGRNTLNNEDT
jgi:hypothetical protein